MNQLKTGTQVCFTAARIAQLDDASARQYRGRTGDVVEFRKGARHVTVEFGPDGQRRPVRLQAVLIEYLEIVADGEA